jgi:hypothetical protein
MPKEALNITHVRSALQQIVGIASPKGVDAASGEDAKVFSQHVGIMLTQANNGEAKRKCQLSVSCVGRPSAKAGESRTPGGNL